MKREMQANRASKPLSRLARMRQLSAFLLAFALGVAAAVALVSCGSGGDAELLPGDTAAEINANLDMVRELADSGDCAGAQSAAQQVSDQIDALGGVDKRLKQALRAGATRLNELVAACVETTTESVSPATSVERTDTTKTRTARRDAAQRAERTTTTTTPTTPTTTPTTTTTTPTSPEGGGTGAPGGVAPGGEAGGSGG